jgi:hypothetical protein
VAIDARGDAVVVWQARSGQMIVPEFSVRVGGRWQEQAPISKTSALLPHVAMNASGDATAVWEGPGGSVVTASKSAAARHWSSPRSLYAEILIFRTIPADRGQPRWSGDRNLGGQFSAGRRPPGSEGRLAASGESRLRRKHAGGVRPAGTGHRDLAATDRGQQHRH